MKCIKLYFKRTRILKIKLEIVNMNNARLKHLTESFNFLKYLDLVIYFITVHFIEIHDLNYKIYLFKILSLSYYVFIDAIRFPDL